MSSFRQWTLAAAAGTLACGSSYASAPVGPGGNNNPGGTQSGSTLNVQVASDYFQPTVDTVAVNSTVTWTWNSGPHTVTFQDGPTSDAQSSGTYTRTFTAAGTYPYRCTIHSTSFTSGMTGTIVVR